MLHRLDSGIGTKPPETNYADDCRLYAPDHASGNPFQPFMEKLDRFIIAHFFGWIIKALMIRDWFILMARCK
jgi:phosphatidylserine synthase 2